MRHIGAKRPMIPYHDHNADQMRPELLNRLSSEAIALVSDAGTPLISDPGFKLVREARAAGHYVTTRSEEHTSELQSLMRISYAVFCLQKKIKQKDTSTT